MSAAVLTSLALSGFLAIFVVIALLAARHNRATPGDFYLAGRSLGPFVLVLTIGATAFSTWTLLGAVGEYYRNGVWFFAFSAWAVVQGFFMWLFGARIWRLSKRYGLITPGDMAEHYYGSITMRLLFAIFGVVGLVPYMLIQVTGGAQALETVSGGVVAYPIGVLLLGFLVGCIVCIAGGRGAAWTDAFMGLFFAAILVSVALSMIINAGGLDAFRSLEPVAPELLTVKDDLGIIIDTCIGLILLVWIFPQAWQKLASARSADAIAKTAALTPIWNSWLMALMAGIIGLLANVPGMVEGITDENSDQVLPLYVSGNVLLGSIVVLGIVAAGLSTINSQMLSSASILTTDLYLRLYDRSASERRRTVLGRAVVLGLTVVVVVIAFTPAAQGYIVPVANNGIAIVTQLVPAALGPLVWRRATRTGALASIIVGESICALTIIFGSPIGFLGATSLGIMAGLPVFIVVSLSTQRERTAIQDEYHDYLIEGLYGGSGVADRV